MNRIEVAIACEDIIDRRMAVSKRAKIKHNAACIIAAELLRMFSLYKFGFAFFITSFYFYFQFLSVEINPDNFADMDLYLFLGIVFSAIGAWLMYNHDSLLVDKYVLKCMELDAEEKAMERARKKAISKVKEIV